VISFQFVEIAVMSQVNSNDLIYPLKFSVILVELPYRLNVEWRPFMRV
jgi:hypothetical protein